MIRAVEQAQGLQWSVPSVWDILISLFQLTSCRSALRLSGHQHDGRLRLRRAISFASIKRCCCTVQSDGKGTCKKPETVGWRKCTAGAYAALLV